LSAPVKSEKRGNRKNAACVSLPNHRKADRPEGIANGVRKLKAF